MYKLQTAVGTKCYHSFKWHAIRLFNSLPQHLRTQQIVVYTCLKIDLTSTYLLYLMIQLLPTMTTMPGSVKLDGDYSVWPEG